MSGASSLGVYLSDMRRRRGVSLEELTRLTRVASRYLHALEADELSVLPAPVFTRGYIRAYCQALHEPVDEALALFQAQSGRVASVPVAPPAAAPPPAESEARRRSTVLVSFVLLVVLGLALFGVTLALQSGRETVKRTAAVTNVTPSLSPASAPPAVPNEAVGEPPSPPAPSVPPSDVAVNRPVTPAPSATVPPAPKAPQASTSAPASAAPPAGASPAPKTPPASTSVSVPAPAPAPAAPDLSAVVAAVTSPYRLVARVSEPTWIRVRTADGHLMEETIPAGQMREWVSNGPFVLTIGNAGGVSFELNGRPLPALGPSGAVISRLVLPPQQ